MIVCRNLYGKSVDFLVPVVMPQASIVTLFDIDRNYNPSR